MQHLESYAVSAYPQQRLEPAGIGRRRPTIIMMRGIRDSVTAIRATTPRIFKLAFVPCGLFNYSTISHTKKTGFCTSKILFFLYHVFSFQLLDLRQ